MFHGNIIVNFLTLFVIVKANNRHSIILPPEPPGPEAPICSSYSSLCHLAYNVSDFGLSATPFTFEDSYRVLHSQEQICRCPHGRTCETDWFSTENSILKTLRNGGMDMVVKMSYCNLRHASRVCRQNEPTLILRGRGALLLELWQDFSCRCYRPLYAHRSWREGDYDYIEYSCGKPRCANNRLPTRKCTRITYQGSIYNLDHDYLCRCRRDEECTGDTLPNENEPEVFQTCRPMNFLPIHWNLQRRKRR